MYNILKKNKRLLVNMPTIFYWLLLFAATSIPSGALAASKNINDKFSHFTGYFILSFLLTLVLHFSSRIRTSGWKLVGIVVMIVSCYGIVDELHQMLIPGRFAEFFDWVADMTGAAAGSVTSYMFLIRKNETTKAVDLNTEHSE